MIESINTVLVVKILYFRNFFLNFELLKNIIMSNISFILLFISNTTRVAILWIKLFRMRLEKMISKSLFEHMFSSIWNSDCGHLDSGINVRALGHRIYCVSRQDRRLYNKLRLTCIYNENDASAFNLNKVINIIIVIVMCCGRNKPTEPVRLYQLAIGDCQCEL